MSLLHQELATLPHRATLLLFPLSMSVSTEPNGPLSLLTPFLMLCLHFLIGKVAVPEAIFRRKRTYSAVHLQVRKTERWL
jgi:hypothetical protein